MIKSRAANNSAWAKSVTFLETKVLEHSHALISCCLWPLSHENSQVDQLRRRSNGPVKSEISGIQLLEKKFTHLCCRKITVPSA